MLDKARRDAIAAQKNLDEKNIASTKNRDDFSGTATTEIAPRSPVSLPDAGLDSAPAGSPSPEPSTAWQHVEWARPLVAAWERDPAFSWPRLLSEPHPNAVGSYGWQAIEWIEARRATDRRIPAGARRLRGFQCLRLVVALSHDDAGALVFGTRLESTPRQQGKSVGLAEEAGWRIHAADVFGEEQLVLHTAKDLAAAREVQREARLWAVDTGLTVRGTHGQEEIELVDGSRWMIRGRDSVYSYSTGFAIVDEAWAVAPAIVDDGLEPTLVERVGGQLLLVSTANRKATTLFPERRRMAIRNLADPGRTLLAEWSAHPESDPYDPAVWRAASAFWSPQRETFLADKIGTTAWREQWLNIWPELSTASVDVWLRRDQLAAGAMVKPRTPAGYAVEVAVEVSDTHRVWACAAAWSDAHGRLVVSVDGGTGSVTDALDRARQWVDEWPGGRLWMHQALTSRVPAGFPATVVPVRQQDAAAATGVFREAVLERRFRHAGAIVLDEIEDVATRVVDGREMIDQAKSRGPVPAIKAAAWASWAVSTAAVELPSVF